jgi:FKBP-type peptidyl-prolyl cis-trans isomerase FkpA
MPPALVRSRRLAAGLALIATSVGFSGCALGGETSLPAYTDPATQTYATSTGVTIANMTRVNAQLYREDVVVGTGRIVNVGDSIGVYYTARLSGGFAFDPGRARPATPFFTVLDSTRLIQGWPQGLAGMRIGGTRRLVIGPELGYRFSTVRDQAGAVLIPANSVITFTVEMAEAITRN